MTKCRAGFATDREQIVCMRTHLKEISPPQYHIHIDNTFRAFGEDSPDKKPRARLIYITIRVNRFKYLRLK